ncbi:MAG: malto-oligosyltrehalose trehalohydrolase [Dehalococcoidia bacterium]
MFEVVDRGTLGAITAAEGGTTFRLWAPKPKSVTLVLRRGEDEQRHEMTEVGDGFRELELPEAGPGDRYGYLVDGAGPFPDPCSRRQPEGVHALSEVVNPAFAWTDASWEPPEFRDLVIYEAHIGTLTREGTFDSAIESLGALREMGVSAIELMPVAAFPGRWNWGYDGVSMFAPAEVYGGPDGLRRFVNAAHEAGIAVILDVVYNHFGPSGNYTGLYSDQYVTDRYHTPWGSAMNFDGPGSEYARAFFRENLQHWRREYHIDGFRFDATHAIFDDSPVHILAELAEAVEGPDGSRPYLIAESHENDPRYVAPRTKGGFGFDAVWADDFHHTIRTMLQDEDDGYLRGFDGTARSVAKTIRQGFYYEGQLDPGYGAVRGKRARNVPWSSFVYCIQNHDQVGNRPFGQRLNTTASHGDFMSASLLMLLLPQIPMLFQGQEFLSRSPFLYFTDHDEELGRAVTEGRRREFGAFRAFAEPASILAIPDPQAESTFARSILDGDDGRYGLGMLAREMYRDALDIRANDPVLRQYRLRRLPIRSTSRGRALALRFEGSVGARWLAVNFGEQTEMVLRGANNARVVLASNEGRFGGNGVPATLNGDRLRIPAHSAVWVSQSR